MNKSAFIFYAFGVFLASIAQILLKAHANEVILDKRDKYGSVKIVIAYGLFVLSMLIGNLALRKIQYKYATIIESMSYFFILVGCRIVFKEKITKRKLSGISMITVGMIIFML